MPQYRSPDELRALQTERLNETIVHAYERVPYYRHAFDARGLRPKDIGLDGLHELPLLTKDDVREAGWSLYEDGVAPTGGFTRHTSGSTGAPLTLHQSEEEGFRLFATWFRAYWSNGQRPWLRFALITDPDTIEKSKPPIFGDRTLLLWSGQNIEAQIKELVDFRPHVIRGFNQSLALLARATLKLGIEDIRPRVVFGLGELTEPDARDAIHRAFGARLVDVYACQETGCIAWECVEQRRRHINADSMIVEIIKDGRPAPRGEDGEVVLTSLVLRQMPLIRYVLGDIARLGTESCSCGRGLPLLELIRGRSDDFVTLPSGRVIPPIGTFAHVLEAEDDVVQYLVIQEATDLLVVKIVAPGVSLDATERIRCGISTLVQEEADVRVEVVDQIEQRSAKMRRVISKVPLAPLVRK